MAARYNFQRISSFIAVKSSLWKYILIRKQIYAQQE